MSSVARLKGRIPSINDVNLTDELIGNTSAPAIKNDTLTVRGFKMSSLGLELPANVSLKDWREIGATIVRLQGAIRWIVGDWINGADAAWGERFVLAAEITGWKPGTLRNVASVAGNVDLSLRNDKLSYNHHVVVAKCDNDTERSYWLSYAIEHGLSVRELRDAINKVENDPQDKEKAAKVAAFRDKVRTVFYGLITQYIAGEGYSQRAITDARAVLDALERNVSPDEIMNMLSYEGDE